MVGEILSAHNLRRSRGFVTNATNLGMVKGRMEKGEKGEQWLTGIKKHESTLKINLNKIEHSDGQ